MSEDKKCNPNLYTIILRWFAYLDKHKLQARMLIGSVSIAIIILAFRIDLKEFYSIIKTIIKTFIVL